MVFQWVEMLYLIVSFSFVQPTEHGGFRSEESGGTTRGMAPDQLHMVTCWCLPRPRQYVESAIRWHSARAGVWISYGY